MPWPWRHVPKCFHSLTPSDSYERRVECRPTPERQSRSSISMNVLAVHHYVTKSEQEFRAKMKRGGGGGTQRKWDMFLDLEKCDDHCQCMLPIVTKGWI